MKSRMMTTSGLCSLATVLAVSVSAAEGYVTLTKSNGTGTGFAGADWSEPVDDPSTRDYLVGNGLVFRPKNGETIPSRSFTFGELKGKTGEFFAYYSTTFGNRGVFFANGQCYTHASDVTVDGLATFVSPSAAPFRFHDDGYRPRGIKFGGLATAAADVHILAYANATNDFYLTFADASAFQGTLTVTSNYNSVGAPYRAYLKLECPSFPGHVILRDGTWIENTVACEVGKITVGKGAEIRSAAALTVSELVLEDTPEMVLQINADTGTSSTHLCVKDALSFVGERLKISLTGTPLRSSVLAATAKPVTIPLLTVPNTFGLEDFELPVFLVDGKNPAFRMIENGQTKTLAAVYYPCVKWTNFLFSGGNVMVSRPVVDDSISAGMLSDGLPPHENAYYDQEKVGRTTSFLSPFNLESITDFPGAALMFGESTALTLQGVEFDVPVISFLQNVSVYGLYSPAQVQTLKFGEMMIAANRTVTMNFRGGSTIIFKGPIRGGDATTLLVTGNSVATASSETFNLLDGDNRNFSGKIAVHTAANRATEDGRGVTTLYVKDGMNLGGARNEFTYDALSVDNKSVLAVIDSATLDEPTRGIYLDSSATLTDADAGVNCVRFSVTNETGALAIKETITLNGTIRKMGAGALGLGGALKFLDGEGNLSDVPPAQADLHKLVMTGGQLKPLAARSMDGLDIVFSNDVSKLEVGVTVDAATPDAELAQYGFVNLKTANPLTATAKTGTVPLTLSNLPTEDPKATFSVPICTVRADVAASVKAFLVPAARKVIIGNAKYKVSIDSSEPFSLGGETAVTIFARITPPMGLVLTIR